MDAARGEGSSVKSFFASKRANGPHLCVSHCCSLLVPQLSTAPAAQLLLQDQEVAATHGHLDSPKYKRAVKISFRMVTPCRSRSARSRCARASPGTRVQAAVRGLLRSKTHSARRDAGARVRRPGGTETAETIYSRRLRARTAEGPTTAAAARILTNSSLRTLASGIPGGRSYRQNPVGGMPMSALVRGHFGVRLQCTLSTTSGPPIREFCKRPRTNHCTCGGNM